MHAEPCPPAAPVLEKLKDFQLRTVEHAFSRLYLAEQPSHRFLVADEVGLGKTLIARGIVAKAVEHLWDDVERIDVLYICSNLDIARQNVDRLKLPGREDIPLASRLTLLPTLLKDLRSQRLNLISFTPGTSLDPRSSMGTAEERALVYLLLERAGWIRHRIPALNLLQGGIVKRETFEGWVEWLRTEREIDETLGADFSEALRVHDLAAPGDKHLQDRFDDLCSRFKRARRHIPDEDRWDRADLIADLRAVLATTCATSLEPDLIILDEFQRFRSLLHDDGSDPAAKLARDLFTWQREETGERARLLLLSATPYKPFTTADDGGEDHYRDFIATLRFLFDGDDAAAEVERELVEYKQQLLTADPDGGHALRARAERLEDLLLKVMCRTERLGASADRNGMLRTVTDAVTVSAADVRSFVRLQTLGDELERPGVLEYWKSAPYVLNFMDGYQLKRELTRELDKPDPSPAVVEALKPDPGFLLPWSSVERFGSLPAANPRLSALFDATVDVDAWKLLWMPPSLPYYEPEGAYADERLQTFTKRLVFSSWHLVPRSVSLLLSYEAERRMTKAFDAKARNTTKAREGRGGLLAFTRTDGRLTGMPVLGLLYPSTALATACDPLVLGEELRQSDRQPSQDGVLHLAKRRIRALLDALPTDAVSRPELGEQIDPLSHPFTWQGEEPAEMTPDWALHLAHRGDFHELRGISAERLLELGATHAHLEGLVALALKAPDRLAAEIVADHATLALEQLGEQSGERRAQRADIEDEAWYWAAPILLDLASDPEGTRHWWSQEGLESTWRGSDESDDATPARWAEHVQHAQALLGGEVPLGRQPDDLAEVLALVGVAGPGVCSLRALARATAVEPTRQGDLRDPASSLAWSLRSRFNLPEVTALVRAEDHETRYWEVLLRHAASGCIQAVLDEYAHVLVEALGVSGDSAEGAAKKLAEEMGGALSLRTASLRLDDIRAKNGSVSVTSRSMRTRFAAPFTESRGSDDGSSLRPGQVRRAFNSPFWPFVLVSTSVGQEGLDFHQYCHAVVHWNLPSNPVDLEQREGRVHRYKSHAVRRNLAARHGAQALSRAGAHDPWMELFRIGTETREDGTSDLVPFWLYAGPAQIERHLPALPLSREIGRFAALQRALVVYRMAFGQSRQDDLIAFLLERHEPEEIDRLLDEAQLDLSPPVVATGRGRDL